MSYDPDAKLLAVVAPSIFDGLPAAKFEADIATEKAKAAIAEAEALLSKTDKQRVAIIRNILHDLEAANGPMDDATKGPIINGLIEIPTAALVNIRDLSLKAKARQTAPPTDKQVSAITQALLDKPQVAFAVARELAQTLLAGPWEFGPRGARRMAPSGRHAATVEPVNGDGDDPPMTVMVGVKDHGTVQSFAAGMDKADKLLAAEGYTLVGDRPLKIVTAWRRANSGKESIARYVRLHDVPDKLNNWPVVASVGGPDPAENREKWVYTLTVQAMIDVPGDLAPMSGTADTLKEAQDAADKWLLAHGWMVP